MATSKDQKTPLLPVAGLVVGALMAIIPFVVTMFGLARVSRVEGGLRGATHVAAMDDDVGFALGSSSASALLVPPGLLIFVMSGLTLAGKRGRGLGPTADSPGTRGEPEAADRDESSLQGDV